MPQLNFLKIDPPAEQEKLFEFFMSEEWPFHVNTRPTREKLASMMAEGAFTGSNHECFWIVNGSGDQIGYIRLIDLDDIGDGYPLFDLRLRAKCRGQGLGREALRWITRYMFEKWPQLDRIAGATRADNKPMRRTFLACGFVKEGHTRKDWGNSTGACHDSVMYGILREDWETGKTTPVNWNDEPL